MAYNNNTNYGAKELTHKQIVLQQILICNSLFSGYEASPMIADQKMGTYDFTPQAHTGKAILLGVLTLEANARPILPEEYQARTDPIKKEILTPIRVEYTNAQGNKANYYGLGIISPSAPTQLNAILKVQNLYAELIAAIYSLPKFSDVISKHKMMDGETLTEAELNVKETVVFDSEANDDNP